MSKNLSDLNALIEGTTQDGHLVFDCPMGHPHRIRVPMGTAHPRAWATSGEFPDTLSLSPSILAAGGGEPFDRSLRDAEYDKASKCGWHGYVTNGEVVTA